MAYIEDLGNGKYKVYVDIGYDSRGKRRRRTKTITATSDRDLNRQARDFEFKCMQQQDEPIDDISFSGFVDRWIKNHVNINLKLSTKDTYTQVVDAYLMDYFGNLKMKDIKRFHIVEFLAKEEKMKRPKLIVLKSIFGKAIEWEIITNNPTDRVRITNQKAEKVKYFNEEELNHLFGILENVYPKHRIMIKLAAIGGLRRAEIAGIREECINFEENYIYVDKQLRYNKHNKEFYLSSPKNNKPRYVYFTDKFMKELKTFVTDLKERRLGMGNAWNPLIIDDEEINLIIVKDDGYPAHIDSMTHEWRKIVKKYDLKEVKFHGLRHSCATLMLNKGIDYKVIQERLGHTNIGITIDTYSHLETERHKESASAFKDLI